MCASWEGSRRLGGLAAIVALTLFAAPAHGQAPAFTKDLKKVNGVPVTTPPASLNNGALLDWVMTYQLNSAQPAQANIKDLLPPTLQYVPGSLQVPPSWSKQWFDGSNWVTAEPASTTGVGAFISFPHVVPSGSGQTVLLPAPPIASLSTTGSGGDGYRAIPHSDGKIDVINHHSFGTYLDCFDPATGLRCPNYPAHVPLTNGTLYGASNPSSNNSDNTTAGQPIEYLDPSNGRLYFPVIDNSTKDLGILCADPSSQSSCGFRSLSTLGTGYQSIQGIDAVGAELYTQLPNGKIGCLNISTLTPCLNQPYAAVSTSFDPYYDSSLIFGNRIYSLWQSYHNPFSSSTLNTTVPYILSCFDTTLKLPCPGWGPKTPDPTGMVGILYPLLNSSGMPVGVCVHTTNPPASAPPPSTPPPSAFNCYDLTTGGVLTSPTNYPASYKTWAQTFAGGWYQAAGYGQPGYYKTRIFNGSYGTAAPGAGGMGCYDFATAASCAEPLWPLKGSGVTDKHYATIADPERPGCMWYYGDDGKLGSFEAADGSPCDSTTILDTIVTPADSYCAGGTVSGWGTLSLAGLTLGGGITATLTIYDGSNLGNLALKSNNLTPYAQNLAVTSLPLNLGIGGLGIGYGTGPGQYTSLRVVLQVNGVTNHTPWTQTPPPSVQITWLGGAPQFCFQTKVATCSGPVVTNQATAVTTPAVGSPFNNVAPVPAFSAAHELGDSCAAGLTVTKKLDGAPAGFIGTFTFYVTCSTSNGLLQQQLSITWPNTTATLNGIPVGSLCTVSEDPTLPALPTGFSWSGVPVSTPANGVITITQEGKNQITFTNTAHACDDRGKVKITKHLEGVPPGFTGTFNFNVTCWSGTTLITKQAQITLPGASTVTVTGIPTGSLCTVTEAPPLPTLPAGWLWLAPAYQPASGQVALSTTCCPEVVVDDRAKLCCAQGEKAGDTSSVVNPQ